MKTALLTAALIVAFSSMPAHASYTLMVQSRQSEGIQTRSGYTYARCRDAAESMDQSAVKAWCVPDPNEPSSGEIAEAERQAIAQRDAVIDPSDLSVEMTIGGTVMGGAPGHPYTTTDYPMFSAVITNHSNKTLRSIRFKIRCADCQGIGEWTARPMSTTVDIPPGGQQTVSDVSREKWRWVNNGRKYTWEITSASACPLNEWDAKLKCP